MQRCRARYQTIHNRGYDALTALVATSTIIIRDQSDKRHSSTRCCYLREVDDVERDRQLIITIMYSLFPAPQKTTCALRTEDDDDGEDDDR